MASINISGLTSSAYGSFDWQTMVDRLIAVDSTPITRLQATESANKEKLASLAQLQTDITTLQSSVQALSDSSLFNGRTATATDSNWKVSAATGTATGTYAITVSQLATAARLTGAGNITAGLSSTDDVTGLTLASLPTATAVTAGTFTVNGQQVTIALTDSLQDVFAKISTATSGAVTAGYSAATDAVTLSSASPVVLGAVNDTSNFLQAMRLANNGTGTITSSFALGAASLNVPIVNARLNAAITAVDGSGNGSFTVNGVSIAYNVNTDSLATVLGRINASTAGVTASYDAAADRIVLTNNTTGDIGAGVNEAAGGLLGALGLTSGATLVHGQNALFSVNGGGTLTSASNTLDGAAFGAAGLSVQAASATTQTITVATDTDAMSTAIQNFINQFNAVQSSIDDQTQITIDSTTGKVQSSLLSGNHDIQNWAEGLRALVFAQVPGLTGTVRRLADLGIDFDSTSSQLTVKDSSKFAAALANSTQDVAAFFDTATTGFAATVNASLNNVLSVHGLLSMASSTLIQQNNSIENQVAALQRQLDQERALLTTAFEAMQTAQSLAQTQLNYLNQMFNNSSNSNE
ncbi:MAG: flagellar filament capping protein FliD [Opitutaceae bacterium]|nr:flagellar filament capping protein FliD [Opitutaceae bacterium]